MRFRLKSCCWRRDGDVLVVVSGLGSRVELDDPGEQVETLLTLLTGSPRTVEGLRAALAERGVEATADEVRAAVDALDELLLLEGADDRSMGSADADDRHFSNLAFFDLFTSLSTSAVQFQRRLRDAHVLQLGTGGLGSNATQNLAGLGVGTLTLLDSDTVEPRNFARQFVYRHRDRGMSKVARAADWVREFDPEIEVATVERRVCGPDDLADLLPGVDLVVSGIDSPDQVDDWVNEACMSAVVPWVRGGMLGRRLIYYSVWPGHAPCLACHRTTDAVNDDELVRQLPRVNRGIGPAASMLGSLVALEAMRYLTGYEPPSAAGADVFIDLTAGVAPVRVEWAADENCALCRSVRDRAAVPVP